jgi:NADH:ubiquinone oxidoreductase subunit
VEYKDYFLRIGINGDRIPAGWHGWLAHHYDDSPAEKTFV